MPDDVDPDELAKAFARADLLRQIRVALRQLSAESVQHAGEVGLGDDQAKALLAPFLGKLSEFGLQATHYAELLEAIEAELGER